MKIGIILQPYNENTPSGLGRFILELAHNMIREDQNNEYIIYMKEKSMTPPTFPGNNWSIICGEGGMFWLDNVIKKNEKADVYIFNTPIMPIFFKPKYGIVIALDFAYKKLSSHSLNGWIKNQFLFLYHRYSLKRADHVVATSKATKHDVESIFGIPEDKISVIYPGFTRISRLEPKPVKLPEKFFFYIGAIKERKNVMNLVKGFIKFKEKTNSNHKLLIGGNNSGKYYEEIVKCIENKNMEEEVIFLGYISDEEALYVHQHAEAFVFVTLIEGSFGMPVLEAMDSGAPVITSDADTSVELKETESALLVDPYNTDEIAEALERVSLEQDLREKLRTNGKKFCHSISWERMAKELIELVTSRAL